MTSAPAPSRDGSKASEQIYFPIRAFSLRSFRSAYPCLSAITIASDSQLGVALSVFRRTINLRRWILHGGAVPHLTSMSGEET